MKELNHENIVKLYTYFEDKLFLYMVLEYCNGGSSKIIFFLIFYKKINYYLEINLHNNLYLFIIFFIYNFFLQNFILYII